MGAANAVSAYVEWSDQLSPLARLVLVRMALTALDEDKTKRYYGGRAVLLESMGRRRPHTDADNRALARVIYELTTAGAIQREQRGRPGKFACYRLNLLPTGRPEGQPGEYPEVDEYTDPDPGAPW